MTTRRPDARPMTELDTWGLLRRACDIHSHRVRRDGADRCMNCGRDLDDVESFAACPDCGCEN